MAPKSAAAAVSNASSVSSNRSSVLKSAFAPSQFQLQLFASVIQSFDSQQLRIHDTSSGRLKCQHETKPGARITSLDWGYYGAAFQDQRHASTKKKRKRDQDVSEGAVVAYASTNAEICFFSPAEGKVVGTLVGGHERGVREFKFTPGDYKHGWSIGDDGNLVHWDLIKNQPLRSIPLPDTAISVLATPSVQSPQILCASSVPLAVHLSPSDDFRIDRYDAFKNPVHTLFRSGASEPSEHYFLAADTERYINIYDISQKRLVRTLVAGSGVVTADFSVPTDISSSGSGQLLAVLTKDGIVELFLEPFAQTKQPNGELKSTRKNLTRKASASVRLINAESKRKQAPITAASLQGPDLVIVSAESAVDLSFQKIRWQDEGNGELLFDGVKEVVRSKATSTLNTATLNGVKDVGKTHVDESRTVVVNGGAVPEGEAIEILSSDSDGADSEDSDVEMENEVDGLNNREEHDSGGEDSDPHDSDVDEDKDESMNDSIASGDEPEPEAGEPTFGELLASKHPGTISIADTFRPDNSALTAKDGLPKIPSGMSLGTVLTQSLRTNDNNLLEACLHTLDINIVKNTIQRLDTSLAGILLSKLAERLATRSGRYGHLITWVQWTCVAHGGAIAAQPDVTAKVRTLYNVLTQRTRTMDNLLLLKGKLDMLDAQLTFRKQLAAQRPARRDDQDEPGVIYIEGKDNWDSSEGEDLDEDLSRPIKKRAQGNGKGKATRRALEDLIGGDDDSEDSEDLVPIANGDADSDEDDEDDSDTSMDDTTAINGRRAKLVDDEAQVSGAEDSDPDDEGDDGVDVDSSSDDNDSSDDDEDDIDDEDEEGDSEMDSFINDGEISLADDEDDVHISGDDDDDDDEQDIDEPVPEPISRPSKQKPSKKAASKYKR